MNERFVYRAIITIEEMGEFTQALTKYIRYMVSDETLRKNRIEIQEMIMEELADVELCLEKFKKYMCINEEDLALIKEYKEKRLNHV
jgi:NTP pyrophosphatase (non-canonical NTP hydrolase)